MKVIIFEKDLYILTHIEVLLAYYGFDCILVHNRIDFINAIKQCNTQLVVFNESFFQKVDVMDIIGENRSRCFFVSYFLELIELSNNVYINELSDSNLFNKSSKILLVLIQLYFLKNEFSMCFYSFDDNKHKKMSNRMNQFSNKFKNSLTKKVYKIFIILNENWESGVKSTEIAQRIWGECSKKKLNSIYVHISHLRKKLHENFNNEYDIIKKNNKYYLTKK